MNVEDRTKDESWALSVETAFPVKELSAQHALTTASSVSTELMDPCDVNYLQKTRLFSF